MRNFDSDESDRRLIQLRIDLDNIKKTQDSIYKKVLNSSNVFAPTTIIESTPVQTVYTGKSSANPTYPFCEIPSGVIDGVNKLFYTTKSILAIPKPILVVSSAVQNPFNNIDFTYQRNQIIYQLAPELNATHWIWYWAGDSLGNARSFNGSGDHILWGANSAWNIGTDLSIAFWINIPSNSTNASTSGTLIFYGDGSTGGNDSYKIFLGGSSNNWAITAGHEDTLSNQDNVTIATGLKNNTWYFIGIVRDSVAKTYSGYIGNGSILNAGSSGAYTHTPASPGGVKLSVGYQWNSGGGLALYLNAVLEEHYIWSRKLNTTELTSVMTGSPSSTNLILACLMGNTPEVDLSLSIGSGIVTGTTLVPGHP